VENNINLITKKITEYNALNRELSRYNFFNDFMVIWKIDGDNIILDMYPTEEVTDDWEKLFKNPLILDLKNTEEIIWIHMIADNLLINVKEKLKEVKEISKPQHGILIYDYQTNTYFNNPNTATTILRSKEIKKKVTWTRLEIFGLFINLRNILFFKDFYKEIKNKGNNIIIEILKKILKKILQNIQLFGKVQYIPIYTLEFFKENNHLTLSAKMIEYLDNKKTLQHFENSFTANLNNRNDLISIYNNIRRIEVISKELLKLKESLINKKDPELYIQSKNNMWITSEIGSKVFENLNLIQFLNKDITKTVFKI